MCNLSESLIEKGEKIGEKIGEEIAEKIGEKIGEERMSRKIAINLLDLLDDETISEKIGLPIETVCQLRRENTE